MCLIAILLKRSYWVAVLPKTWSKLKQFSPSSIIVLSYLMERSPFFLGYRSLRNTLMLLQESTELYVGSVPFLLYLSSFKWLPLTLLLSSLSRYSSGRWIEIRWTSGCEVRLWNPEESSILAGDVCREGPNDGNYIEFWLPLSIFLWCKIVVKIIIMLLNYHTKLLLLFSAYLFSS